MGETAEQWRTRQQELMGEAAARIEDEQLKALADVLLGANLHTLSALKVDLIDQRELLTDQGDAIEAHGKLLDQLMQVTRQLEQGLGVADQIEGRALEQVEALAAQVGPPEPDTNGTRTITQRLADLEAAHVLARAQRAVIRRWLYLIGGLELARLIWDGVRFGIQVALQAGG